MSDKDDVHINFLFFSSPATTTANPLLRKDTRCGSAFPLSDGSPAQCDPYGELFCCSKWGFCGFTSEHCECAECTDFRKGDSLNITEGI